MSSRYGKDRERERRSHSLLSTANKQRLSDPTRRPHAIDGRGMKMSRRNVVYQSIEEGERDADTGIHSIQVVTCTHVSME